MGIIRNHAGNNQRKYWEWRNRIIWEKLGIIGTSLVLRECRVGRGPLGAGVPFRVSCTHAQNVVQHCGDGACVIPMSTAYWNSLVQNAYAKHYLAPSMVNQHHKTWRKLRTRKLHFFSGSWATQRRVELLRWWTPATGIACYMGYPVLKKLEM